MCAGAARPSMISAIAAAASSAVRSSWRVSFSSSSVNIITVRLIPDTAGTTEKIAQYRLALARENRLGMELHAVHRPRAMPQAHDGGVLARPRRHFELGRQRLLGNHERVIPRRLERSGDPAEHAAAVVLDGRRLAVHRHD